MAKVAEGFLNLGEREKSRQILQQHLEQVGTLSPRQWSGYARGLFAEQLARFDLEEALKLVEELEPAYQARHLINIAHIMGSENPPAAEMVLKRVNNGGLSQTGVVRVVYRMAPVDLPRAMRLVQNIDVSEFPADRPHALGVMAYALKDQDPQKARKLLRQALEELPFPSTYGNWRAWQIFGVGFTLARFAEEIDPDNLTDYFWQALARAPTPDLTYHVVGQWMKANEIALLAKLAVPVAQYDAMPGMAQQLAEPIFQYLDELGEGAPMALYDAEAVFTVIALVHPDRAVDWAIRYHQNLPEQRRNDALQPWLILSRILTSSRWEIGQSIDRSVFYLWTIDQYDL
ncbi:MAG: hypothetical protein KatS3mg110_1863 [Pirellulaceae bacterium]|nr:MAG: hypothetical protein KatS3mg110_1863 [Pirellulaceae bacterium]